jgi:autotransporter-associated beta strand protein
MPQVVAALMAVCVALATVESRGQAIYKINNTNNLNLTTSWSTTSGSQTPNPASIGSTDAAYFNEATMLGTKTVALGGDLALGGLALDFVTSNNANNLTISAGNTLTLNGTTLDGGGRAGAGGGTYNNAGILLNRGTGGTMTINCNVTVGANQTWTMSRSLTVGGGVDIGARTLSFNVAGGTTLLSGPLSGSGTITKTGGNNFNLTGDGTNFTGTLTNTSSQAMAIGLTTAKNATAVNSTGTGYLAMFSAGTTYIRNINVTSTNGFRADYGDAGTKTAIIEQTVNGAISSQIVQGSRVIAITKTGAATLTISAGTNTASGAFNVNEGTLKLGSAVALGTTASGTSVASGAVLDLNGQTIGAEALTLNGTGISSGGALLNTSATAASLSGAVTLASATGIGGTGNITLSGGVGGGSNALTKVGGNTLTLSGANSFTGTTTISAGTLALGSSATLASTVIDVGSGATFDVSAITGGFTLASGRRLGGAGSLLGNLVFGTGSQLAFSTTDTLTASSGTVSFISGFGIDDLFGLDGTTVAEGTYTLIAGTVDFTGLDNVGFANRQAIGGGKEAYFNQGSLQVIVVPEPSTLVCLAGGLLTALGLRLGSRCRRR